MQKSLSPGSLFLRLIKDAAIHHPAVRFLARTTGAIQKPFIWMSAYREYSQSMNQARKQFDAGKITDFDYGCCEEDAAAKYTDRLAKPQPSRLFEPVG